jgi:hypothetical protein
MECRMVQVLFVSEAVAFGEFDIVTLDVTREHTGGIGCPEGNHLSDADTRQQVGG